MNFLSLPNDILFDDLPGEFLDLPSIVSLSFTCKRMSVLKPVHGTAVAFQGKVNRDALVLGMGLHYQHKPLDLILWCVAKGYWFLLRYFVRIFEVKRQMNYFDIELIYHNLIIYGTK